jgi:hypothetical protein
MNKSSFPKKRQKRRSYPLENKVFKFITRKEIAIAVSDVFESFVMTKFKPNLLFP